MFTKSKQDYSKRSLTQSIDTMSNSSNGVFDMVHDEKTAKMDPEKWAAINDPRPAERTNNNDDRVMVSGMPVRRVENRLSTPGAYRVGDTESYYGGRTVGDDSDDGSASEFMVVPRAALVDDKEDDKEKDGVMKDVEAPTNSKIPIVTAERSFPDALHSEPQKKKSSHKRKFRCCMLLFCLLLALLLGGVLYMLSKDELATLVSPDATDGGGNRDDNGDRNRDDNDGRRGDGNGDRGNGRGNDND